MIVVIFRSCQFWPLRKLLSELRNLPWLWWCRGCLIYRFLKLRCILRFHSKRAPSPVISSHNSTYRGHNPNYTSIRPVIGVATPFISRRGPSCSTCRVLSRQPDRSYFSWSLLRPPEFLEGAYIAKVHGLEILEVKNWMVQSSNHNHIWDDFGFTPIAKEFVGLVGHVRMRHVTSL